MLIPATISIVTQQDPQPQTPSVPVQPARSSFAEYLELIRQNDTSDDAARREETARRASTTEDQNPPVKHPRTTAEHDGGEKHLTAETVSDTEAASSRLREENDLTKRSDVAERSDDVELDHKAVSREKRQKNTVTDSHAGMAAVHSPRQETPKPPRGEAKDHAIARVGRKTTGRDTPVPSGSESRGGVPTDNDAQLPWQTDENSTPSGERQDDETSEIRENATEARNRLPAAEPENVISSEQPVRQVLSAVNSESALPQQASREDRRANLQKTGARTERIRRGEAAQELQNTRILEQEVVQNQRSETAVREIIVDLQPERTEDVDGMNLVQTVRHAQTDGTIDQGMPRFVPQAQLARRLNGDLGRSIVRQANVMLKDADRGEIRLVIRPPELGRVRINLQMDNGHIAGRILVDNGSVREVFEQNLGALQRAFAEAGLELGDLEISAGGEQHQGNDASDRPSASRRRVSDQFEESVEPLTRYEYGGRHINLVA